MDQDHSSSSSSDSLRLTMKSIAESDRPREKMLQHGVGTLTSAELLAILIGSGTADKNAIQLCQEILQHTNNRFSDLSRLGMGELMQYKGIGTAKAATICAAMEIANRRHIEKPLEGTKLDSISTVYDTMKFLTYLDHEEVWIIIVNNQLVEQARIKISEGMESTSLIDVRKILRTVLLKNNRSFFVIHNHPAGTCRPSRNDDEATKSICEGARLVGLKLIDHVIVSANGYYSYQENGLI